MAIRIKLRPNTFNLRQLFTNDLGYIRQRGPFRDHELQRYEAVWGWDWEATIDFLKTRANIAVGQLFATIPRQYVGYHVQFASGGFSMLSLRVATTDGWVDGLSLLFEEAALFYCDCSLS